ncbi:hypothetical protein IY145_08575 [Methylosinus sp. H3A]|uniref:hypothetical protein n=1 Tax=Methylosinus sp. H3A TaxID=2785786 RepID=UPI0018C2B597|nr:hypothetical protein [Methylosinus sp. H3A]MBG0809432.1 hypothetical protein [Methylosinus sp. H3A]
MTSNVDFVFVDQIAVGLLVTEGECKRFCGASTALAPLEGAVFADLAEAETIVARHLRGARERGCAG